MGECVGSPLVGRLRKMWIASVNDCLTRRGLSFVQPRRMVYDRNEWRGYFGLEGREEYDC